MTLFKYKDRKKSPRIRGVVIDFHRLKGYGFIRTEDNAKVFAHYSDIVGTDFRTLIEGETVEFSIVDGNKGPQATQIVRLDPPDDQEDDDVAPPERSW